MQFSRIARFSILSAAALLLATTAPASAQQRPSAATLQRLDRVIEERMNASGIPGMSLAVVAGDGVVHARGLGDADASGRTVTADTPFVTGSSGKAFTALAVMQLVDEGSVNLDAPVRRYVPELRTADGRAARISVRHLLQHTSGFREEAGGPLLRSAADGTPLEAVGEVAEEKLVSAPGRTWHYSNVNYVLAGLVVERASGERFAQYMRSHVFAPLGMGRTFTSIDNARAAGVATGSRYWFGIARWHGPTFRTAVQAAGYYVSTATDLARFLRVFLDGGVVDGQRIISDRGLRTLVASGPDARLGPWADGASARYAMGWFRGGPWREPLLFHPGNTPDSSSMIIVMPGRGWAAASMTNASEEQPLPGNPSAPDRLGRNVADVLLGEPVGGVSAHRFYAVFDLLAGVVFALLAWSLVSAALALRRGGTIGHRARAVAGIIARGTGGLIVVLAPGISGGWASSWLWAPDLTLILVVFGAMLLATAALRTGCLVRGSYRRPPLHQHAVTTHAAAQRDRQLMTR